MNRLGKVLSVTLIAGGAGLAGLWAGQTGTGAADVAGFVRSGLARLSVELGIPPGDAAPNSKTAPTGTVVYYRHPDGDPAYAAAPKQTSDGRAYTPVYSSEEVSFDPEALAERSKGELPEGTRGNGPAEAGRTAMVDLVAGRILYYRNPMGLPDTSPVPKTDSMGMAYLPVYEGEQGDGSTVTVSPGRLQRSGVKTALAVRTTISRPVVVPGSVALDERRVSIVSIRTQAFIESVADVTTGATLAKGAPLMRVYAPEIAAAGALYAADLGQAGQARAGGSLQRLLNFGAPAALVAEIEATGTAPVAFTVLAPRAGVVLERMAVEGMMAEAGDPLFRIADPSVVWVMADVPEGDLASVRRRAKATVRFRSLPGRVFNGVVNEIYPEIMAQTRTARVRIELPNPDGTMLANMYGDVEIAAGGMAPVIAVPDSAVIDSGDRRVVILDLGDGRFEPRAVQVGLRGGGLVEISEGVVEGDRVVVSANFLIDAESNLKAALSALSGPEAQP